MPSVREPGGDYEAGMAAFSDGRYEQALVHLEALGGDQSPKATLARFYAGQAHLRLGMRRFGEQRFAAAADHFRRAAAANPSAGGLCRYLATCYMAMRRHDLAALEMAKAVDEHPDDVDTRIRFALLTWKSGQVDRAIEILRRGLETLPDEPDLLYQLGTMVGSEERYEEAIDLLRRCLDRNPNHGRAHARLAQCLGAINRAEDALEHLRHAQRLDPNDAMTAFQLSLLSGQAPARARGGDLRLREPVVLDLNDRRAIERLAAMIQEEPEFVDAFLSLPASDVDREVFGALLRVVERAIEEHPQYADLRFRCGQILARLGRVNDAVTQAEQALAINPHYVNALIQIAQLYQTTDRADEAIARLQHAIDLGANYPDVHYLLGQLYQSRGCVAEARWAYEHALNLNGRFDAARRALSALVA